MEKMTGHLDGFWETGMPNVVAIFNDSARDGYDAIIALENDDYLTIFSDNTYENKLWEGFLRFDYEAGKQVNKGYGLFGRVVETQHAGPYHTINGIPTGFTPDQWGRVLSQNLPATLVKAPKP